VFKVRKTGIFVLEPGIKWFSCSYMITLNVVSSSVPSMKLVHLLKLGLEINRIPALWVFVHKTAPHIILLMVGYHTTSPLI
jgi:hypothetical protein